MKKIFLIILSCFIITALFSSCSNNEPLQSSVNPSSDQPSDVYKRQALWNGSFSNC